MNLTEDDLYASSIIAQCEYLSWDSEFFGVRIGRVRATPQSGDDFKAIERWAIANAIDCLYLVLPGDSVEQTIHAENYRFKLVEVRVNYECGSMQHNDPPSSSVTIRAARESDIPTLQTIASYSHRQTRFYADPHFDRERCDELYREWIRRSCTGWADHVVVAALDGRPCGYIALQVDGTTGKISLVGVDRAVHRQGVGTLMVDASLRYLASRAVTCVKWPTSARNVASQRLCSKGGFRLESVETWHHWWRA